MTRSRRRTPIYGCTSCDSEKQDKAVWHGRMRATERDLLLKGDFEAHLTTLKEQVSNTLKEAGTPTTPQPGCEAEGARAIDSIGGGA